MTLTLTSECGPTATIGTLTAPGVVMATIELPWRENLHGISCVPAGTYELRPYVSPRHGRTWRLHDPAVGVYATEGAPATARTEIEIHTGNWASESKGCILVGLAAGELAARPGVPAVLSSGEALAWLRGLLDGTSEEDTLVITRTGLYDGP